MRFRLTLTRTSYPYGASFGIQMVRMNLPSLLYSASPVRPEPSCALDSAEKILSILGSENIPHVLLGRVGTEMLRMRSADFELSWSIADLYDDWFNAIRRAVETDQEPVRSL